MLLYDANMLAISTHYMHMPTDLKTKHSSKKDKSHRNGGSCLIINPINLCSGSAEVNHRIMLFTLINSRLHRLFQIIIIFIICCAIPPYRYTPDIRVCRMLVQSKRINRVIVNFIGWRQHPSADPVFRIGWSAPC